MFPSLLEAGAVAVSDDGKTVMNAELMRQALAFSAELDFPVMVHCEEHNLNSGSVMNLGETSRKLNLPGARMPPRILSLRVTLCSPN